MDWESSCSTVGGSSACSASSSASSDTGAFKATLMWQELVVGFRDGMPRQRRRVKMRQYEECFTGSDAVTWLHEYLKASGTFGTVSKDQAVKLLQKFHQSDVIREVRGKQIQFTEDGSCRYSFVTEPGPFNFVEETTSPLGKRERSMSCSTRGERLREGPRRSGAVFTNSYALSKIDEDVEDGKGVRKKSARLSVMDVNSGTTKPSPSQVADIWKELTLTRLLRLIEMPALDGVLSHDAVDGKQIVQNAIWGFLPRMFQPLNGHGRSHPSQPPVQACRGQVVSDLMVLASATEAVEDFPGWVITMLNCLSKWPEGCPADVVTGHPQTFGLEMEVLQSLEQYLCALPEPLISTHLYSLHMAVNRLVREGRPSARDALQLCSLLLPQTNRTRVHRLLRAINKASNNPQLHLSSTQSNRDVMISMLAMVVLRPDSKLECTEQDQRDIRNLVLFMSQNYSHIFKVPEDLKRQADKRIKALTTGKDTTDMWAEKSFCKRVSRTEYESQMKATSQQSISSLLDRIASDENMTDKERKQKLKLFQQQYPDIYAKKFGRASPTSSPRMSFTRSWQFHSLRKRSSSKPIHR